MARRKPLYYEYVPGEKLVHEVFTEPQKCEPGQYRSRWRVWGKPGEKFTEYYGTQVVICCPKGTRMDIKARCCKPLRGKKKDVCVGKPITQSIRHTVEKFKARHPDIWKKLIRAKMTPEGSKIYYPK